MTDHGPEPAGTVRLTFNRHTSFQHVDDPIHKDLSALARSGASLFTCCDESAGIDRLTETPKGWGRHRHFGLGKLFDLPDGPGGEMDIEGLDIDDGWLWIVGSQSLKRDKPDAGDDAVAAMTAMADIDRDPNRQFLGRVPLRETAKGLEPVARDGKRRAAAAKFRKGGVLRKWLRDDPHLGPFLDLPSKENGLDIEGIATKGRRVWLGLRGPVLRDCAVILELHVKLTGSGHLKARRIEEGRRYRKHLLPTKGQGVRDLKRDGDDLLVLTGKTMAGDGPAEVHRWKGATRVAASGLRDGADLVHLTELPYRGTRDHPEGMARWPEAGEDAWLVVYDSPAEARLGKRGGRPTITADIWRLA